MILERLLLAGTGLTANSVSTVFKQRTCMKKKKNRQKANSRTNVHSRMHTSYHTSYHTNQLIFTCKV